MIHASVHLYKSFYYYSILKSCFDATKIDNEKIIEDLDRKYISSSKCLIFYFF